MRYAMLAAISLRACYGMPGTDNDHTVPPAEKSTWISETMVTCATASGGGRSFDFVITAGLRAGSLSEAYSYEKPLPDSVSGSSPQPTTATETLTITGSQWHVNSVGARLGFTAPQVTDWVDETELVCLFGPGTGEALVLVVTAGLSAGSKASGHKYIVPQPWNRSHVNLETSAGETLTVTGSMFGLLTSSAVLRVGGTACAFTVWHADTSVQGLVREGACSFLTLSPLSL